MEKTYSPILTKSTQDNFFNYISALDIPYIDYIAIGLQNKILKTSISLMSRPEWQKQFIDNNYVTSDPVRRISLQANRNIIPFMEIDHLDSMGREIMRQRARMEIKDGIILMQRFSEYNYMITLGTNFSKFDAHDFLRKNYMDIALLKNNLISIIEKDMKEFIPIDLQF